MRSCCVRRTLFLEDVDGGVADRTTAAIVYVTIDARACVFMGE